MALFVMILVRWIASGASSHHLVSEPLEPQQGFALALVNQPDGGGRRHRSRYDRQGSVTDGLVDIVVAIVATPHGPFETDGGYRAGADLRIARSFRQRRGRGLVLGDISLPRLKGLRGIV